HHRDRDAIRGGQRIQLYPLRMPRGPLARDKEIRKLAHGDSRADDTGTWRGGAVAARWTLGRQRRTAALSARDKSDRSRGWRHEAHVRLRRAPALRVDLLRLLVGHRACDDHVLALLPVRSEEHTSELQSRFDLVCRLLLEKKKTKKK